MATLQELIDRTRLELSDLKVPLYERVSGSGSSARFDLKGVQNVTDIYVYPLGDPEAVLDEGTDYTLHAREGLIVFPEPPPAGTVFVVEGEYSRFFGDEELEIFVRTAFEMHTRGRNPRISYGALPSHEVLLVAILAQIEALWVLKASSAYDINVHAPEGMFIPRGQRFEQLNRFLMEVEQRYKDLSGALGVGLYAVEMFNLRRVSRTTGRYVPVYIDREFDDTRIPQRVFPTVGNQFADMPEPSEDDVVLQMYQGRSFERILELFEDDGEYTLTGADEFEAQIFMSPYATNTLREDVPQFTVETDATSVTLSLTAEQTAKFESNGSYVWVVSWRRDGEEITRVQGRLLVEAGFPLKSPRIKVV